MPRRAPEQSGYARIAQAEEEEEEEESQAVYSDHEDPFADSNSIIAVQHGSYRSHNGMHKRNGSTTPKQIARRKRANSGVDIKAINARLERWAEEIKERFKMKRPRDKGHEDEQLEIYSSVFQAPDWIRPANKHTLDTEYDDGADRLSKLEFDDIVESVRTAIELGRQPTLISQGSSGSYFARNSTGKVVGVFKPKDEEPYASKNPKWTKWIHRNLFPFAFGRACLIPNLSYVSEAAAYLLDVQLRTNLVPYTDIVSLSSKSFFYDYFDRRAFQQKGKPLPEKLGSFQVFLKGYKGATEFFREHPWPEQSVSYFRDVPKRKKSRVWTENCRGGGGQLDNGEQPQTANSTDEFSAAGGGGGGDDDDGDDPEFWSEGLQQSFREQLEKLVILDYIMRNTDRGTDNWMIRVDPQQQKASIVVRPPPPGDTDLVTDNEYPRRDDTMSTVQASSDQPSTPHIGAIDNSLSWPWKHPDAWRSYPFGWLFLPVSLIGRPFSMSTRQHFLPLLTSKEWWIDTQAKLRACFEIDADFQEKMFARQMAVMKGQAWNVVEALKTEDHGPLELTRRSRVYVWDDVVEIPVAVPLPRASEEMRRKAQTFRSRSSQQTSGIEDEQDITTVLAMNQPNVSQDILGLAPTSQEPQANQFNHSRHNSAEVSINLSQSVELPKPNSTTGDVRNLAKSSSRPGALRSNTGTNRKSLDLSRNNRLSKHNFRPRPLSFSAKRPIGIHEPEEDDGDLGYAAAADQDRSRRKVIVERLETVKTRQPFFTCC